MAKNLDNIRIYDGEAGAVFVAPKGTTGPTDLTAPPAGFAEVGWISEDGIDESLDQSAEVFRAWQGAKVVRRKVTQSERTFRFQALEENLVTHGLKYRGQTPTIVGEVARTEVKNQTAQDTRAWVFDVLDGDVHKRFVVPSGDYTMTGAIQYRNSSMTIHEFEVTPTGDYIELTNDPAITGE